LKLLSAADVVKFLVDPLLTIMSFRYIDDGDLYASGAYVGLALPGEAGSWQRECKVN